MALVLHGCNEQGTQIILPHGFVVTTHTKIFHEVGQLLQGSHKPTLLLKVDTEPLIHWVELVPKLTDLPCE